MFKKAIAGVLSAVMCASALLYDVPFSSMNTAQEGEQVPAASQDAQPDSGLTGSNSLARYLSKQGAEQAASQPAAQPLKASAADAVFAVTNLDFDRETGTIQVTSTQSEAAKLLVSFIDEDNPANVYSVGYDVPAGEYVRSTFTADPALLPEYFTVRAKLTGRAGLPLCKAFEIGTYQREMQAIIEKETADFAQEQVVNLDEDETTNFIVLSEDTVRAETTDEHNILVSADYDQNIYVFDHIDDSIRSLEKGQYFYIQPTDADIISTDIREIVIDGDTATITGSGEIDDMFDFIKIEVDTAQTIGTEEAPWLQEAAEPEEAALQEEASERSYLGVSAKVIDSEDEYNQKLEELEAIDKGAKLTEIKRTDTLKGDVFKKGPITVTPSLKLETTVKWNVYKSFSYTNVFFVIEEKSTLEITAKAKAQSPESLSDLDTAIPSGAETNPEYNDLPDVVANSGEEDKTPKHLIKIPITTIGAADICFFIDIGLTLSVEGKIAAEKSFTKGFAYDSEHGFEKIDFDTAPTLTDFTLKGTATLDIKLGVEASALKGLIVASAAGGLKITATVSINGNDNKTYNPTGTNVFQASPASADECIHADKTCIKIEISFKVYIEVKLSIGFKVKDKNKLLKMLGKLKFERSYTYETDEILGHKLPKFVVFISLDTPSAFNDHGLQIYKVGVDPDTGKEEKIECAHKAYRLSFLIDFQNAPAGTTAELLIDGNSYELSPVSQSRMTLHAVPRSSAYTYYINVNGSRVIADSVLVKDSYKLVRHTISWPEDGTGGPDADTGASEDGPAITTAPRPAETAEEPSFDYSAYVPAANLISSGDEQYDLGTHISGMFSNDGTFTVIGYGDMYESAFIPGSVAAKIRRIVFNDQDPEEGLYINNIADELFYGAEDLEVVYMPERLTAIGRSAFHGCKNLKWLRYNGGSDNTTTFVLPESLKTIGNSTFRGCSAAEFGDLKIPAAVTTIGNDAFAECKKITSVTIPGTAAATLGSTVFLNCANIKEVYIGKNVRCADNEYAYWFHGCPAVEKMTIPTFNVGARKAEWILQDLFNGSGSVPDVLTDVTVLSGTVIPRDYFWGLAQLKNVTYPNNITEIGASAFNGCSGLPEIILPNTLTTIGNYAFRGCSAAEFGDLKIPAAVTSIGNDAFAECKKITSVTISDANTTTLGSSVFLDCTGIKEAYLGKNVKCVDTEYAYWFGGCSALKKLTIPAFNAGIKKAEWILQDLFNGSGSVPDSLTDVTVLSGTVIPRDYFWGLAQLKNVTYPNNITEIGASAFNGCSGLPEIILPNTLTTIGNYAFRGCSAAEFGDLKIPAAVTTIGNDAFAECKKITSVTISDANTTTLGSSVFLDCTGIKEGYLGKNVKCSDTEYAYWFGGCSAMEKLTIPAFNVGIKKSEWILQDLFNGSGSVPEVLTDVTVLSGTVIPRDYFWGLAQLKSVTYPDNITEIGASAFNGCSGLQEISLPNTLTTIGNSAFRGCSAAEFGELVLPESVTSIGSNAFQDCEKLISVTVPGVSETTLGSSVFLNCTGMKEAVLGQNVKCEDTEYAYWFGGCSALRKLTIPAFNVGIKKSEWILQDLFNGSGSVPDVLTDVTVLSGTIIPRDYFWGLSCIASVTFSVELETVEASAFSGCTSLAEAYLIGSDSDWDKVEIAEYGNQPLLDIVRKGRPIVILSDLHDVTVEEGQTAEFAIYAAGRNELTYLWQYSTDGGSNWWTKSGWYNNTLSFPAVQGGYMYRCEVRDGFGNSVMSSEVTLTVTEKQSVPTGKQAPHVPGYKPGDVNGDNSIDVSDAVLIARFAIGDTSANIKDIGVINGDVNGDGNTDIQDVTTLLLYIAKRIRVFPVEET